MKYTNEEKRALLINALDFLEDAPIDTCLGICLGTIQSWIGVASDARFLKMDIEAALGNYESQSNKEAEK